MLDNENENSLAGGSCKGTGTAGTRECSLEDHITRASLLEPLFGAGFKIIELRGKRPIQADWGDFTVPGLALEEVEAVFAHKGRVPHNVGVAIPCGWMVLDWDEKHEVAGSDSRKLIADFLATCPAVASGSGRSIHRD